MSDVVQVLLVSSFYAAIPAGEPLDICGALEGIRNRGKAPQPDKAQMDFTPTLKWWVPGEEDPNRGKIELIVNVADHVFALASIVQDSDGARYWYESDTDAHGEPSPHWEIAELVDQLRSELPKWAALLPDVSPELLVEWERERAVMAAEEL